MAGDSGGVFGSAVAVGDGGALTLDKNRARRSTRKRLVRNTGDEDCGAYPACSCGLSSQAPFAGWTPSSCWHSSWTREVLRNGQDPDPFRWMKSPLGARETTAYENGE